MTKPLVSILCITYNHVKFIRSCLESLVNQKCDFPFEIIIYDDASTDGAQDIIKEFYKKYPNLITPILRTENQWSKNPGVIDILYNNPQAKGKYIAFCEGDDYWIDQDKLQKQVMILEAYPECTLTCGAYLQINKDKKDVVCQKTWQTENPEDINGRFFELEDLSNNFFIKTSTSMFRNVPTLFDELKKFDYCLDMHTAYLLLKTGKGYYSKEVFIGYNRHQDGVHSGSTSQEILLVQYLILKDLYEKDPHEFFRKQYLKLTMALLALKISGKMPSRRIGQNINITRNPRLLQIIKDIKPVLETKAEYQMFYKSLIPLQTKLLKQKLKRLLSTQGS